MRIGFQDRRTRRMAPRRDARWKLRLLGLLIVLAALAVQNLSSWIIYRQVRRSLDQELGERLLAVAATASAGLPADWRRSVAQGGSGSPDRMRLQSFLEQVSQDTQVGNIFVFDVEKRNLFDLRERFPPGFVNPLLDLHYAQVTAALAGVPAATPLYQEGNVYLKAAFAPVADGEDVVGGLGVEASAAFFRVLADLRQMFLWAGGLVLLAMLILGFLFLRLLSGLSKAEATVAQTSALAVAGELAAMVAHEIRNPLAVIRSRVERVRSKIEHGADRDEILEWFEVIPRQVDHLNRVLSGYLAFARPAAGKEPAGRVALAAQAAHNLMEGECARKGIRLSLRLQVPPDLRARLPGHDIQQILVNLMLNAMQALDARGGEIEIAVHGSGSRVHLVVSDSGPGIDPEDAEKIFDPFFTTKPAGSGLGLAIVRMLAEAGGGRVRVERSHLGGAALHVELAAGGPGEEEEPRAARGDVADRRDGDGPRTEKTGEASCS